MKLYKEFSIRKYCTTKRSKLILSIPSRVYVRDRFDITGDTFFLKNVNIWKSFKFFFWSANHLKY